MIRNRCAVILLSTIALQNCDREKGVGASGTEGNEKEQVVGSGSPISQSNSPNITRVDVEPARDDASKVVTQNDIVVNGKPACALTVRYAGALDQPVTWRGEKCSEIRIDFLSLKDLENIGQVKKLDQEALDDLAKLPSGRTLYVEGQFSSAIYPASSSGIIYQVPLAD
jgi:hypothetical protein